MFNQQTLSQILKVVNKMALDITALQAAVAKQTTVEQSAVTLLTTLTTEIKALAANTVDPATVQALNDLAAKVDSNATALAGAVTQNTPASP